MRIPIRCPNCNAVSEYNQIKLSPKRKRKHCECGHWFDIKTPSILPRETLSRIPSPSEREEDELRILFENQRSVCILDIRRIFPTWSKSKCYRFKDRCLGKRIIREAHRSGRQIFWERCSSEIYNEPNPRALRLHNLRITFPIVIKNPGFRTDRKTLMGNWTGYYMDQERWTVYITPNKIIYMSKDHYYCESLQQIQNLELQLASHIMENLIPFFEENGFMLDYNYTIKDEIGDNRMQSELSTRNYRINSSGGETFDQSPGPGSREIDYELEDRIREMDSPNRIDDLERRVDSIQSELNQHTNILESTTNSLENLVERTTEIDTINYEINGLKRISENLKIICSNLSQAIGINRWIG